MSDTWDDGYEESLDDGHEFAERHLSNPYEEEGGGDLTLDDPRSERLDKGVVPARFKGTCVVCEFPIRLDDLITGQGATVIDPIELPDELRFGNEYEMEVLYHEFKADLNAYLASLGPDAPIKSLQELIEYNERNVDLELSLFGQELLITAQERGPLTEARYLNALSTSHPSQI